MILVIDDPHFVLMEECSPFPTQNASQGVKDAYDCWTKVNDKARLYILASMSDILSKKHEIMVTARQIMDSFREMFGQPSIQIKQEAIKYVYNARMKEGQSVTEHVLDIIINFNVVEMNGKVFDEKSQVSYILKSLSKSFLQFRSNTEINKIDYNMTTLLKELSKKIQKKKGGKGKGHTSIAEGKGKAKVASRENISTAMWMDIRKETTLSTLLRRKKRKETSSFKQLEEDEMILKVGTGDIISARVVGDVKLFFRK
ncbi:gag/pol protein [Cucumis melo var. makuwa]|uniref:Gag/pol protein n=1 Tax=Cucumis melo var. makuwa TaxID=1194695 RepID=A0A5A7TJT4_CUCMM|nr:gag/pol protein [Cucumis melo var. makuwa]TYK05343.1 gag/pol protein [Cucumis melo var. makuwa]